MKNIHVISTEKPRKYRGGKVSTFTAVASMIPAEFITNIYITSDEEITGFEDNIWVIKGERIFFWQNIMALVSNNKPKKIILTTDQDLIKDGVQVIPDEFLEWFCKNSSCEEVGFSTYHFKGGIGGKLHYKIIIPKEEPKQELERGITITHVGKQETLEDNTISKERLERAFLNAKKHMEKGNIAKFRASGFLEGILFASNELEEDKDFVFKNIKYLEIGWFGKKTIKTRKQTYSEFIIEKFESFLKNKKNG